MEEIINIKAILPSLEDVILGVKVLLAVSIVCLSILLLFFWENKVVWWARLPIINLFVLLLLLILGIIQEIYLTFHPSERTKYIKTSIFQLFFS